MIHLLGFDGEMFRLDDETGNVWSLQQDSDDKPVWVLIKTQPEEEN
jgi:hypothetical protein